MRGNRWALLALLFALVLSLGAVSCGGDDDDESSDTTATTAEGGGEDVSGSVTILADWTGAEGESFKAVLDGFGDKYPNVDATYRPSTNLGQDLATAVEGGNPPPLAAIPAPGIMRDYFNRGSLKPLDFAKDTVSQNYTQDWQTVGTIDGKLYGVMFKGANKSTVWYSKEAFDDAGVEPPTTFDEFTKAAETIQASGIPPFALGGSDGWTLTDLFENIYAQDAGPAKYRQLANHEIPWTDPSVKDALTKMAELLESDYLLGGTTGALQLAFSDSVTRVLAKPPKAAMITEGDFVPGVASGQTNAKAGTDYDFFEFPKIGDQSTTVSGGNIVVMFKDTPASQALVEFLASPEAGEIWAKRGGFSSPNKNVPESAYTDPIFKRAATGIAQAESLVFDMSDMAPGAFAGEEFSIMQNFLKNPSNVAGTQARLEAAAKKTYKNFIR